MNTLIRIFRTGNCLYSKAINLFYIIIGLFFCCNAFGFDRPGWVQQRPIDKNYYLGIGRSEKTVNNYAEEARNMALSEISSEISVTIQEQINIRVFENNKDFQQEYFRQLRSFTTAELEGYELFGTWEDETTYWVYYRLSKELYSEIQKRKMNAASSSATDHLISARSSLSQKNIHSAIINNLQALTAIEKYLNEPLIVNIEGNETYLSNTIIRELIEITNNISLKSMSKELDIDILFNEPIELTVQAIYESADNEHKIRNLPVRFSFIRGNGELISNVRTNNDGVATSRLMRLNSSDKLQTIVAELDLNAYMSDTTLIANLGFTRLLNIPSDLIILNLSGLKIFLDSEEKVFGKLNPVPFLAPRVVSRLTQIEGVEVVDNESLADLIINIVADTRRGTEVYSGMYNSFANVRIRVFNKLTGNEIYSNNFSNIAGVNVSYENASVAAYERALRHISTDLLTQINNILKTDSCD